MNAKETVVDSDSMPRMAPIPVTDHEYYLLPLTEFKQGVVSSLCLLAFCIFYFVLRWEIFAVCDGFETARASYKLFQAHAPI